MPVFHAELDLTDLVLPAAITLADGLRLSQNQGLFQRRIIITMKLATDLAPHGDCLASLVPQVAFVARLSRPV